MRRARQAGSRPQALAEAVSELEELNRSLIRQTINLRKAYEVLENRNRQNVREMNLAVELQKSLLPKSYPDTPLVTFTHRYIPLAMVGGDFFYTAKLDERRVGVLLADVSGHGVAPAFITAMIRSAVDYLIPRETSPAAVLRRLNAEFSKIIDTDHFVTAFYAIFDFDSMVCTYCSAGHPSQLLAHADGSFDELRTENPIIGMVDDFEFRDARGAFRGGDLLCFYTDGVIESRDARNRLFGLEGLKKVLSAAIDESVDGVADALITRLIEYMRDPYFEDDITLLIGRVIETL